MTTVPRGVSTLMSDRFDIAHAFTTPDALTGLTWRRLSGRPVVFTPVGPMGREHLADRRLSLWLLERALQDTDAVTATSEESRAALLRWLAIDVPVLAAGDAAGYARLYRELLGRRD